MSSFHKSGFWHAMETVEGLHVTGPDPIALANISNRLKAVSDPVQISLVIASAAKQSRNERSFPEIATPLTRLAMTETGLTTIS